MKRVALGALELYQRFAPRRVRDACRFRPSCSEYAKLAIKEHGFLRGTVLAVRRLKRCVPPNGGVDLTGLSLSAAQAEWWWKVSATPSEQSPRGCGDALGHNRGREPRKGEPLAPSR